MGRQRGDSQEVGHFFFLYIYLFYFFIFGCVGSSLLRGLSLVVASGGLLFVAVQGLLIAVAWLVAEHGLQARGLQ